MLSGAGAYAWFRDVFGEPELVTAADGHTSAFALLDALAARAPPGSGGLVFLPYLASAGAPHWNRDARGAFIGIGAQHDRAHFARAVMEGVAMEMLDNLDRLDAYGASTHTVRLGGGASRSDLWNQIQADIYGRPVDLLTEPETAALGAALLGGVGAGLFRSIQEGVDAMVHVRETRQPDPRRHSHYRELHAAHKSAYQALAASTFDRLARLQATEGQDR